MMYHTVPISAMEKVQSTVKASWCGKTQFAEIPFKRIRQRQYCPAIWQYKPPAGCKKVYQDTFAEALQRYNQKQNRENICKVYDTLLEQLQQEMPDFKIANAVVHFDEASPHMHVVGVPIGRGFKRGAGNKGFQTLRFHA